MSLDEVVESQVQQGRMTLTLASSHSGVEGSAGSLLRSARLYPGVVIGIPFGVGGK